MFFKVENIATFFFLHYFRVPLADFNHIQFFVLFLYLTAQSNAKCTAKSQQFYEINNYFLPFFLNHGYVELCCIVVCTICTIRQPKVKPYKCKEISFVRHRKGKSWRKTGNKIERLKEKCLNRISPPPEAIQYTFVVNLRNGERTFLRIDLSKQNHHFVLDCLSTRFYGIVYLIFKNHPAFLLPFFAMLRKIAVMSRAGKKMKRNESFDDRNGRIH